MTKQLVSFTARYQGCIVLDVPAGDDVEDILYDQSHSALFDACETKIAMDIFNVEDYDDDTDITTDEMNQFFDIHMSNIVNNFKRVSPERKFAMMQQLKALTEDFLEYYEHFSVDNAV